MSLYSYYVGLDLGQSQDYTAVSVLEEPVYLHPEHAAYFSAFDNDGKLLEHWVSPALLTPHVVEQALSIAWYYGRPPDPPISVRHLERFDLGTPYPRIIERVQALLGTPPLRSCRTIFLVDKTGVGAGVVDAFVEAGVSLKAITIHGGSEVGKDPQRPGYRVPKRDLVSAVQVLLQNRRLKVSGALPLAETLKKELLNFRVKIDPNTAHDSYEHWREGDHDDLVLATAVAAWFRQWWNRDIDKRSARDGGHYVADGYAQQQWDAPTLHPGVERVAGWRH